MHFIWMWHRDAACCLQKLPNEYFHTCKPLVRATVADHMASIAQIRVNVATGVSIKTAENCLFAVKLWTYMWL